MATLSAAVDINDRASSKFNKLVESAERFERALDKVSHKIKELELDIDRLNSKRINVQADVDTAGATTQLAALRAEIASVDGSNINVGAGGVSSGLGGAAGDVAAGARNARKKGGNLSRLDNGIFGAGSSVFKMAIQGFKIMSPLIENVTKGFLNMGRVAGEMVVPALSNVSETSSKAISMFASMAGGIGAVGVIGGVLVGVVGGLSQAVMVLAAAITSLLVPLAAATSLITGLVGAIAFGVAPLIIWTMQTKKLVDQKKQLQERLKYLTPGTKAYTKAQEELAKVQDKLNKNGGEGIFSKITKFIKTIESSIFTKKNTKTFVNILNEALKAIKPLLPVVSFLVGEFSNVMLGLTKRLRGFTSSKEGLAWIKKLFTSVLPLVDLMGQALGYIVKIFGDIAIAAAPVAKELLGEFVGWLKGIEKYLSSPAGIKSMKEFFAQMKPVFKEMVVLVKDFVVGFVKLGVAGIPLAKAFFGWLRDVGPKIVNWISETAEKYGPILIGILRIIGKSIAFGWNMLTLMVDGARPLIDIFLAIGNKVADLLDWFQKMTEQTHLLDAFKLVWDGIKIAIEAVVGFVDRIVSGIKWLIDNISKLGSFFSGTGSSPFSTDANGNVTVAPQGSGAANAMQGKNLDGSPNNDGDPTTLKMAKGGVVTRPTHALIGEAGPEAVIPLNKMNSTMRPINISGDLHFHGVQDLNTFVSQVQKYVANLPRESSAGMSNG